jgi:hypothetical protein
MEKYPLACFATVAFGTAPWINADVVERDSGSPKMGVLHSV